MNDQRCPNQATHAVPWGGKIQRMCDTHTRGLLGLGRAIGANVFPERMSLQQFINCDGPNDLQDYADAERSLREKAECETICGDGSGKPIVNHYFNCPLYEEDKNYGSNSH